jgi:1-acyl-sn-glycerol-3-phosphate acyltransferase
MDGWQRAMGLFLWAPMKLAYRLEARGAENLPDGGCVLASNHLSKFDPWILAYPLWPKRRLRSMAKAELFNPLLRGLLNASGAIPIKQGKADASAFRTAVEVVRSGEVLLIFPEGARRGKGPSKNRPARPYPGAARIALAAGVPLVPAAIVGTDRLTRLGPMRIAVGPPVVTADLRGRSQREAAQMATDRLMTTIAELEAGLRLSR